MSDFKDLVDQFKGRITDPARLELLTTVATDMAQLQIRALAGEDVAREIAHCKAQASLLYATEAMFLRDTFMQWVTDTASRVLVGVAVAGASGRV